MECRHIKRTTRRLEKKYRRTLFPSDRLIWIDQLKKQSDFFRQKEQLYWLLCIESNSASQKKLEKDLDVLMRESAADPSPDDASQADFFQSFSFSLRRSTRSGRTLLVVPKQIWQTTLAPPSARSSYWLQTVGGSESSRSEQALIQLTLLVKNFGSLLASYFSALFIRSLKEGYLPSSQKAAMINYTINQEKRTVDCTRQSERTTGLYQTSRSYQTSTNVWYLYS